MTKRSSQQNTESPNFNSRVSTSSLQKSKIVQRLTSSQKKSPTKEFSNFSQYLSTGEKSKTFKILKVQSFDTAATFESFQTQEEQKFTIRYKNDVFFRKNIDILVREYEEKSQKEQQKSFFRGLKPMGDLNTWRSKKSSENLEMMELYMKCKEWIDKIEPQK